MKYETICSVRGDNRQVLPRNLYRGANTVFLIVKGIVPPGEALFLNCLMLNVEKE